MKASGPLKLMTAFVATMTVACEPVKAPLVELTGVRVRGIGLRGATVVAELGIDNPNKFAIQSDSVTFEFSARDPRNQGTWSRVTEGTNTQQVRIEEASRTVVEIPIEFAYSDLGGPIRSILDRGVLDYRINGRVFVRKPLRRSVPFSREGSVALGGGR
jgi:LEA14-like dessication related protein